MIRLASFACVAALLAGEAAAQTTMQPLSLLPKLPAATATPVARPVRRPPPLPPPRPAFEAEEAVSATREKDAPATPPGAAPVIAGSAPILAAPTLASAPRLEPKPEPEVEPKPEPKHEPKVEPKVEPKPEVKPEAKPAPVPPAPVASTPQPAAPAQTTAPPLNPPAAPAPTPAAPVAQQPQPLSFAAPGPAAIPAPASSASMQAPEPVEFRPRNEPAPPGLLEASLGKTMDVADYLWSGARHQAARLAWWDDGSALAQRDELFRQAMSAAGFDVELATSEGFLITSHTMVFVARRNATALERERATQLGAELAKLGGWRGYVEQAALRRAVEQPAPDALPIQSIEVQLWPYPWIKSVLGSMKPR